MYFPLRDADAGDSTAFESEEITLDAIAKNHAIMRHVRRDLEHLTCRDRAAHQLGGRYTADERFADAEPQLLGLRVESVAIAELLNRRVLHELPGHAGRPGQDRSEEHTS